MQIHIYRTDLAYEQYCGNTDAFSHLSHLHHCQRHGKELAEPIRPLERMLNAARQFLAYEVNTSFAKILRQPIPCHPSSVLVFCEEEREGWSSIYIVSSIAIDHLTAWQFAHLTLHDCGHVETSHADGRNRPSFTLEEPQRLAQLAPCTPLREISA